MSLENPLWQYALTLYSRSGVEQCCLQLQDQGAVVNRLLFACWLASQGIKLDHDRLHQSGNRWQPEVTRPLRAVRFRVREQLAALPEAEACYRALRQAELAAEQLELMLLWQDGQSWLPDSEVGAALFQHNLQQVLGEHYSRVSGVLLLQLQSAAIALLDDD
jgi:uncharacterized protein (TIGR02444 family)